MNVISFCLYGSHPKYCVGAVRNSELIHHIYPAWRMWVYVDYATVPHDVVSKLFANNANLIGISRNVPPMMNRFLAMDDPRVDRMLSRDCDSRLCKREAEAVQEWIVSDKILHIMRDHPAHITVPGGMFGMMCKRDNWRVPSVRRIIDEFVKENGGVEKCSEYGADQDMLTQLIWPWARTSVLIHDSSECRRKRHPDSRRFPSKREHPRFIGEVWEIDENGNEFPRPGDFEQITEDGE